MDKRVYATGELCRPSAWLQGSLKLSMAIDDCLWHLEQEEPFKVATGEISEDLSYQEYPIDAAGFSAYGLTNGGEKYTAYVYGCHGKAVRVATNFYLGWLLKHV